MGLKPTKLVTPVRTGRTLHPVRPDPEERLAPRREHQLPPEKNKSGRPKYINWKLILGAVATEAIKIHRQYGGVDDPSLWFFRWEGFGKDVLDSMIGATIPSWEELSVNLNWRSSSPEASAILLGRLLCRLLIPSHPLTKDGCRSWFSRVKVGKDFWINPLQVLKNTVWSGFSSNLEEFFSLLDVIQPILRKRGVSIPVTDQFGWDFSGLRTIFQVAERDNLSWRGLLLDLIQRQKEALKREPDWTHKWKLDLNSIVNCQIQLFEKSELPTRYQEWKVDTILALGLPGGVHVSSQVRFGVDFRTLERHDMRLIAVTKSNAIYRDWKGKQHSEGFPLPTQQVVRSWGPAIQIWMTSENYKELLPHWYNPPLKCPWSWYEKWGDELYKADGTAKQPSEFRPPVTWLEAM
jgi:hypothetical protein